MLANTEPHFKLLVLADRLFECLFSLFDSVKCQFSTTAFDLTTAERDTVPR